MELFSSQYLLLTQKIYSKQGCRKCVNGWSESLYSWCLGWRKFGKIFTVGSY